MPVIEELIRREEDGTISFGNYLMDSKKKVLDFEVDGVMYNVKTFKEITKLGINGKMLFESLPGVTVHNFYMNDKKTTFNVEGKDDAQITIELEADTEYKVFIDDTNVGRVKTNLSGKLIFSVELSEGTAVKIKAEKV